MAYLSFALNLAALTLNLAILFHQGPRLFNLLTAALTAICLRAMYPIVRRRLRE